MSREHENWFLNSHLSAVTMWVGHHRIAYKHRHIETLCCYNDGKAVIAITSLPIGKYLKMRLQVFNIFFPAPSDLLCQLWLQQLSDYPEGFDKCPFRGSHSQWCGLAQDCRPILLRPQVSAKIFYFPNLREGKKLRVLLLPGMTSSGREFSTSWTAWSPPWWRTGSGGSSTWSPPSSGGGGASRGRRGSSWWDSSWLRAGLTTVPGSVVHLDVEDCSEKLLRQHSNAIKNQLVASKAPYECSTLSSSDGETETSHRS